ncbi:retrovirus-related pol polyprotein from transposon TNT 1-94 [Tanacetum coccineum]|uniref:Retrovirus-related pol polyprotein from transposon TNT 1-94 n=1 Tax=Tanacetum coccineum TaxID=301880 RepID=A0ABQ5C822_9ASTR
MERHHMTCSEEDILTSAISMFFSYHINIHNHRDHLGKFDAKADDGFFLGYSLVAKVFRVFNIRRQDMEETYHVTFSEDDEAISKSSKEGDDINFNENGSFPDDEFIILRNTVSQCSRNDRYVSYFPMFLHMIPFPQTTSLSLIPLHHLIPSTDPITVADDHHVFNEHDDSESVEDLRYAIDQVSLIKKAISKAEPSTTNVSPSTEARITTRSRIRDYEDASAHECLYVNFLSKIESKKLIEALEEEGWIVAMQEELNQFERNKVWTLVPIPHGKTIIGTKWI